MNTDDETDDMGFFRLRVRLILRGASERWAVGRFACGFFLASGFLIVSVVDIHAAGP